MLGRHRSLLALGLALLLGGTAPLLAETFGQGAGTTTGTGAGPVLLTPVAPVSDQPGPCRLRIATRAELTYEQTAEGVYLWKFVAFLQGPDLARVSEVTYRLPRGYRPDHYRVTGGPGFAMSAWALTGLRLGAEVTFRDGREQTLWYEMVLDGEDHP